MLWLRTRDDLCYEPHGAKFDIVIRFGEATNFDGIRVLEEATEPFDGVIPDCECHFWTNTLHIEALDAFLFIYQGLQGKQGLLKAICRVIYTVEFDIKDCFLIKCFDLLTHPFCEGTRTPLEILVDREVCVVDLDAEISDTVTGIR